MIKLAICDDNMDELSNMVSLIEEFRTRNNILMEYTIFHNGFELISAVEKDNAFDIYCLDIIMPSFNGIELAKEIRTFDSNTQIIFFTSSKEFALDSYSVKAVNYVLKPVTKDKLFYALTDVLEKIQKTDDEFIVVKSCDGIQRILIANLVYIEAMGKKVIYHTSFEKNIECLEKFSDVCEKLNKEKIFIKPHRSYLVNMNYIDNINSSEIILHTGYSIPIAQGKFKEIKEHYLTFLMEE